MVVRARRLIVSFFVSGGRECADVVLDEGNERTLGGRLARQFRRWWDVADSESQARGERVSSSEAALQVILEIATARCYSVIFRRQHRDLLQRY